MLRPGGKYTCTSPCMRRWGTAPPPLYRKMWQRWSAWIWAAWAKRLQCTEREVSICAKDSGGPYDYVVTTALVEAAKRARAAYADVYPHYGSDAEAALRAGYDVRHGLIGAGVYASHGYERSHVDGVEKHP